MGKLLFILGYAWGRGYGAVWRWLHTYAVTFEVTNDPRGYSREEVVRLVTHRVTRDYNRRFARWLP